MLLELVQKCIWYMFLKRLLSYILQVAHHYHIIHHLTLTSLLVWLPKKVGFTDKLYWFAPYPCSLQLYL